MLNHYFKCSQTELLLFEKLCAMWDEEILYRIFLHRVEALAYGIEKILLIFLKKLANANFAVIRTICDERGHYAPEKIILSDRHSPFVAQSIIEEQYYRMNHNPTLPYVTEDMLHIPDHVKKQHLKTVSLVDLYAMNEGGGAKETKIYRIILQGVPIIFCFSAFNDFRIATEKKVRSYLRSTHLISDIQRTHFTFMDSENMRVAVEKLQYNEVGTLLVYMIQNYPRITGTYPPAERHLLQAITITHYVNEVQSERDLQLQLKSKRITLDFKSIYNAIHNAPRQIISKEEYHELIEVYKNSWGDLFEENVTKLYTNSPAHPLLIADHAVIHKEHLQDYFSKNYSEIQAKIYQLLIEDMYKHIKIGDLSININYTNISKLEEHLLHILKSVDSILYHLLKYPHHYSIAKTNIRYHVMVAFNVSVNQIFFTACRKLSFFRKLLYRLSNEYADLQSHFHFIASVTKSTREKEHREMPIDELSPDESNSQNAFQILFSSQEQTSA